jgi:hypothetical protein
LNIGKRTEYRRGRWEEEGRKRRRMNINKYM